MIVRLSALNKLRFADDPLSVRTLRHWAATGRLAGAFKYHGTGDWRVDLNVFDQAHSEQVQSAANDSHEQNSLESEADEIMRQLQA